MSPTATADSHSSNPNPAAPKPSAPGFVTEFRFTAMDRCDSCGAQAYVGAKVNGTELLFCAHHGRKYETKLRAVATSWHDESIRLVEDQSRAGGSHH